MNYVRLYADEAGETHFEDVRLPGRTRTFPTSSSTEIVSDLLAVDGVLFREIIEDHPPDVPHPAPERLFIVQLQGAVEVTVSDGERRRFGPGSIVLVEDTHGKGHTTRSVGETPRRTLLISLGNGTPAT